MGVYERLIAEIELTLEEAAVAVIASARRSANEVVVDERALIELGQRVVFERGYSAPRKARLR